MKLFLLLCLSIPLCLTAPLDKNGSKSKERSVKKEKEHLDADPEYIRYLEELMKDMNDNPALRKQLNNASKEDIKKGFLGDKLSRLSDQVRSQLEESKRKSVEQLRVLQKLKNLQGTKFDKKDVEILKLEKDFGIKLPNHFNDKDVDQLMQEVYITVCTWCDGLTNAFLLSRSERRCSMIWIRKDMRILSITKCSWPIRGKRS